MKAKLFVGALMAVGVLGAATPKRIVCGGDQPCEYTGHLQGVATDAKSIYWSFTTSLVRTDLEGKPLVTIGVPRHHGDLCVEGGLVYVAVNLGRFNQENAGKSVVMAYDAETLAKRNEWVIDMPHGAGGMTAKDGRFYVVGGLPATHECNYVYEYDSAFKLIRRHTLATGYTHLGIQTAFYDGRRFLFGIYGAAGNPSGVLECPADLTSFVRRAERGSMGILMLGGQYYSGGSIKGKKPKFFGGCLVREKATFGTGPAWAPAKARQAELKLFFEATTPSGWKDCGYALKADGYSPLVAHKEPFVPMSKVADADVVPAVGIGGDRSYSVGDLVRAVRRLAEKNEFMAVHIPGDRARAQKDAKLAKTLQAMKDEARRLNVTVTIVGE